MKKSLYIILAAASLAFVSCQEPNNIPSPGNNDHHLTDTIDLGSIAVDDASELDVPEGCLSVKEAYAMGKELSTANGTTPGSYYIKGVVVTAPTWGVYKDKINATFEIADSPYALDHFTCYQVYGPNDGFTESGYGVSLGNVIVLCGKIKNYSGKIENDYDAYIYSTTYKEPVIETSGDGTLAKPYSVADVQALKSRTPGNFYVRATIVGSMPNEEVPLTTDNLEQAAPFTKMSNILLADNATETDVTAMMPVKLIKDKEHKETADTRAALNLIDHPELLGTEIIIYGPLEKVFNLDGVAMVTWAKVGENTYGIAPEN